MDSKSSNDATVGQKGSIFDEYPNDEKALNQIQTDMDGWDRV